MQPSKTNTEIPRRNIVSEWSPAERIIHDAMSEIEHLGAHPLLTDAVILLDKAKHKIADYIELPKVSYPSPEALLLTMVERGGCIVTSDCCSTQEIAMAQACNRFTIIGSFGFVLRPHTK